MWLKKVEDTGRICSGMEMDWREDEETGKVERREVLVRSWCEGGGEDRS